MSGGTRQRIKIALIEPSGRGGIHHYSLGLAQSLFQQGHSVTMFTARDAEHQPRNCAFEIVRLFDRLRTPAWQVLRALRRFDPDVLHLQSATHPGLHVAFGTAARVMTGKPLVVTAHNAVPKGARRHGVWAAGALYRLADHVVVHGRMVAEELRHRLGVTGSKISVIPHGESGHLVQGVVRAIAPDDRPTLLIYGFLHPLKGLEVMLDAMPAAIAQVPDLRLVIAGKPEMDVAPLRLQADRLGIAEAVEWHLGYQSDEETRERFESAQVVVLPYTQASMSGVLFLAGAYERPVVATRIGDLSDVVVHGSNGLLVPPGNPAALAQAVVDVAGDLSRARIMGRVHSRRCRSEFGWSAIAKRTTQMYNTLLTGGQRGQELEQ